MNHAQIWTPAENDILKARAGVIPLSELALLLKGRTESAIRIQARKFDLNLDVTPKMVAPWKDPANIEKARTMAAALMSPEDIGTALGGFPKHSILEMGRRYKIAFGARPGKQNAKQQAISEGKFNAPVAAPVAPVFFPLDHSKPVPMVGAPLSVCRWPLDGQGDSVALCCGAPVDGRGRLTRHYCADHSAVATVAPHKVQRASAHG